MVAYEEKILKLLLSKTELELQLFRPIVAFYHFYKNINNIRQMQCNFEFHKIVFFWSDFYLSFLNQYFVS